MEIGGTDVVFPVKDATAAMRAFVRIVRDRWPDAMYEDVETGVKHDLGTPVGTVREVFVYRDAEAEAAWAYDCPASPDDSMLYLIARPESGDFTVVCDDPDTDEMRTMFDTFRAWLRRTSR